MNVKNDSETLLRLKSYSQTLGAPFQLLHTMLCGTGKPLVKTALITIEKMQF
jgi:hypothetical protein